MEKTTEFKRMDAEALKRHMDGHHEKDYLLVDVRQPAEYETHHIPGALLKPLPQLMQSFDGLPLDKDLIFYCHVGSRSQAAAMTAAEEAVFEKEIFTLEGGIMGWTGKKQAPMPRLTVFEDARTLSEFLETAMNMEKGAERFYRAAYEKFTKSNFAKTLDVLAGVETAHARLLYDIYARTVDVRELLPFETFYQDLKGDILEGGERFDQCVARMGEIDVNPCIAVLEFALDIEFSAYDLYRTHANLKFDDASVAEAFLSVAQAEKKHMRMITAALDQC